MLYGRAPVHAAALIERLKAGDAAAAAAIGLPPDLVAAQAGALDAATLAFVAPLVDKAAFVAAVDEAWAMMAALVALALLAVPFARRAPKSLRPVGSRVTMRFRCLPQSSSTVPSAASARAELAAPLICRPAVAKIAMIELSACV